MGFRSFARSFYRLWQCSDSSHRYSLAAVVSYFLRCDNAAKWTRGRFEACARNVAQKQEGSFAAPLKTGAAQDEEILVKTLRQWLERRIERRVGIKHQTSKSAATATATATGIAKRPTTRRVGRYRTKDETRPPRNARTLRVLRARRWPLQIHR